MTLWLLIGIPAGGALAALSGGTPAWARKAAAVFAGATVAAAVGAWSAYSGSPGGEPVRAGLPGVSGFVRLSADGLSIPLVLLTAVLGLVAVLASWRIERQRTHMALLLSLEAALMTVFLAADLVLFYVAWEAVLIPMFFLIGGWGHEERRRAAMKFFLYTFAGSALMLVGIVVLVLTRGGDTAVEGAAVTGWQGRAVFWLLAAGLLVKVPAWPLHTWLPDAHVEAPTAGSIMLAGVLLKMGGYGIARLLVVSTPEAFARYAPLLAAAGIVGIVYGGALALGQSDLKRLIACSSIAHMGFVVLALSTGTASGLGAALLGMVSHGLVSGLLFLLAGALNDRAHTRRIDAFGGLGASMPAWGTAFVVASLASAGLPGLSGFPGEFWSLVAAFGKWGWWAAAGVLGTVVAAAYALHPVRTIVGGEPSAERSYPDLFIHELAAVVPLVALIVVLGVWPRAVTDLASVTVSAIAAALEVVAR